MKLSLFVSQTGHFAGRGSSFHDDAIEQSALLKSLEEKSKSAVEPEGGYGAIQVTQTKNNPDKFLLSYFATQDCKAYVGNRNYLSRDNSALSREDFEDYRQGGSEIDQRIDDFFEELRSGKLQ